MAHVTRRIGLSLGADICWPICFEQILKRLDLSVTYAIWSGVGTALAALIGIAYFREPLTLIKVASLALVILGVVGLSLAARQTN